MGAPVLAGPQSKCNEMEGDWAVTSPVFVIVNPAAGNGAARRAWPAVQSRLQALGIRYELEFSQGRMTAESFARQALRAGSETIVAVGGDGTISEVVNGFFLKDAPVRPGARLLIVPAGSSSDIALGLGIPAGAAAVDLIWDGQLTSIDVGRAAFVEDGRPTVRFFLNSADIGLGARIAHRAAGLKWAGGRLAFLVSSLRSLIDAEAWSGSVQIDDGPLEPIHALTALVALGPYTGAGMQVAPGAKWDDGVFDLVVIDDMPRIELLRSFSRVYDGTLLSHPRVHHHTGRKILIEVGPGGATGKTAVALELDGETVGSGGAEFRILPAALQVFVPKP